MARRLKHWAHLKGEGKGLYGHIYPKAQVPVVSMIPQRRKLNGIKDPQLCYMVYLDELTEEQFEKTVEMFHERSAVSKDIIREEIRKIGLPLRAKHTSGSGTDHPGFFV